MNTSSKKVKRKPGRPATGTDPFVGLRLPEKLIQAIDAKAKRTKSTRSKVIRDAVEKDLKADG